MAFLLAEVDLQFLFQPFQSLRSLSLFEIGVRVFLSLVLGGILGFERGLKNKSAGLKTYILVSLGAAIVMMTNQYVYQSVGQQGDPVRMAAQVISGIGFLGAGSIIVTTKHQIRGLTTAASLWGAATIGLAIGIGAYEIAILGTLVLYLVLELLQNLTSYIAEKKKQFEIYVELDKQIKITQFNEMLKEKNILISKIEFVPDIHTTSDAIALLLHFSQKQAYSLEEIITILESIEAVHYLEKV